MKSRCLACETNCLFHEFNSGKTLPFVPTSFIAAAEIYFGCEIGLEAFDAREFLEKVIEGLHDSLEESRKSGNCNCSIHDMFYGISQTTYFCECDHSYLDPAIPFRLLYINRSCDDLKFSEQVDLLTCLDNYIKPKSTHLTCPKCKKSKLKEQIKIRKLPLVVILVLIDDGCEKGVKVPQVINLPSKLLSEYDTEKTHSSDSSACYSKDYDYHFYASVLHQKINDSGHYTALVRHNQSWFHCDDTIIKKYSFEKLERFQFQLAESISGQKLIFSTLSYIHIVKRFHTPSIFLPLCAVAAVAEWYRHRIVAGFVTSSSPVPLKTRRLGQRCMLNLSRAETSSRWCGS
ncbi:ubiquitin carboxyl-terminal hydrolase [Trichonephila clavipes]|nr:ubiquitin carboxyl-terminal hydrolase [Trichonephila clavipes]